MQKTISSLVNKNSLKAIFNFFYRISISFFFNWWLDKKADKFDESHTSGIQTDDNADKPE